MSRIVNLALDRLDLTEPLAIYELKPLPKNRLEIKYDQLLIDYLDLKMRYKLLEKQIELAA